MLDRKRKDELERIYGKPYINEDLISKVLKARNSELLHDDSFKIWEHQDDFSDADKRWFSELGRSIENLSKDEFAVITCVAVENYPEMVFQIMMEEYLSVVNKENKKDDDNRRN